MSTRLHLSLLTTAILLQAGTAAAELPERERATPASDFAALAAIEAEPLGPDEMDEVQGRTDVMTVSDMLRLQLYMQNLSLQYAMLSDVAKTQHDNIKNTLTALK